MNIILINQWYPPESGLGGVAKYNYYTAHAYKRLGHNVFVISKSARKEECYKEEGGIHVYRIRQIAIPPFFKKMPFLWSFLRFIRDLIYSFKARKKLIELDKRFKIDIVEYTEINSEGFAHSLFGPKRVPFIIRCHTPYLILRDYYSKPEFVSVNSPFIYWMERTFIKKAPHLTAPSAHLAKTISQRFGINKDKITVIPNGIDINRFFPEINYSENRDKIKLLFVGRIERGKGIFVLLDALTEVMKVYRERLKCIFAGPDYSPLGGLLTHQALIDTFSKRGILGDIEYKGEVSEDDLIRYYQECDIFINPSLIYESFSYTCLEALSCGKPVVASRIGGIPEVVEDERTGLLFEPGNIEDLITKLKVLIEDKDKRENMGREARKRVEEYFDALKVAEKNIKTYERFCKKDRFSSFGKKVS